MDNKHEAHTVCPRSLDPFHRVYYNIKWIKTSWTYSKTYIQYSKNIKSMVIAFSKDLLLILKSNFHKVITCLGTIFILSNYYLVCAGRQNKRKRTVTTTTPSKPAPRKLKSDFSKLTRY